MDLSSLKVKATAEGRSQEAGSSVWEMRRVEIESPAIQSPVGDNHDESMPDDERQRLQMLHGQVCGPPLR